MDLFDGVLRDAFEKSLSANAARIAINCNGEQLTYAELDRRSRQVMAGFGAIGLDVGDRVAICLQNCVEFAITELAILRYGGCKVPISASLTAAQVTELVAHSGARVVVSADAHAAAIGGEEPPAGVVAIVRNGERPSQIVPFAAFGASDLPAPRNPISPDAYAAIFYTGGTTGVPKGVCHSQRGLVACLYSHIIEAEIHADERILLTTPLNHAAGMFMLTGLLRGAEVTIHSKFSVEAVLEAFCDGMTWSFMVPTMIYRLLDAIPESGARAATSLRTIVYGAAPIAVERLRHAINTLGPVFIQLYAQTECPDFATTLKKRDHIAALSDGDQRLLASCGQAVLMTDVKIVDDDGHELAAGEIGEVCLHSPYTMKSYYHNPEATRKVTLDGGWLRTGDMGLLDDRGYLHLKDRRNDVVVSGGLNVYSADVEAIIARCTGVASVAIIGVPDSDWGEAVHAVITLAPGAERSAVESYCRTSLGNYQRPKSYDYVHELPLTPYGKIDKKRLREPYWQGRERAIH